MHIVWFTTDVLEVRFERRAGTQSHRHGRFDGTSGVRKLPHEIQLISPPRRRKPISRFTQALGSDIIFPPLISDLMAASPSIPSTTNCLAVDLSPSAFGLDGVENLFVKSIVKTSCFIP